MSTRRRHGDNGVPANGNDTETTIEGDAMTEQTPADLVAEARDCADRRRLTATHPFNRLADSLEAVTAERDALGAILSGVRESISLAREHASYSKSGIDGDLLAEGIEDVLSGLPADTLDARFNTEFWLRWASARLTDREAQ